MIISLNNLKSVILQHEFILKSVMPIEVKSGRDYTIHSALNKLLSNPDYHIKSAIVVSNERIVRQVGNVKYFPIYYIMFLDKEEMGSEEVIF